MTEIKKIKEVIKENFSSYRCGIFFTQNITGDSTKKIYQDERVSIYVCDCYEYFEIFGLTQDEKNEIEKFYDNKCLEV